MNARNARINITIAGKNVTKDLAPYLEGFTYTDVLDGEADTAEITLNDKDRKFIGEWFPTRGDTCDVDIVRTDWNGETGDEVLPLGTFEIDDVDNSYPPNVAKIKLVSVPNSTNLRSIQKSKSWENVKLSKIANDIATAAGVNLLYDTEKDFDIKRAEQREQSDLSFLHKLCKDKGLALKVSDTQLIIFDELRYESQPPVRTLEYGSSFIKHFDGRATIRNIYKAAHVKYKHGKKGEFIESTFTGGSDEAGMTLEINKKVESLAEADELAKKELRKKNKDEIKVSLSLVGSFEYVAGNVIELANHGFYNGNYIIERATHTVGGSGGYTVSVEARKCLSGY